MSEPTKEPRTSIIGEDVREEMAEQKAAKEAKTGLRDINGPVEPLGPGQKYFETPDGRILIGQADKDHLFDRVTGSLINPRR